MSSGEMLAGFVSCAKLAGGYTVTFLEQAMEGFGAAKAALGAGCADGGTLQKHVESFLKPDFPNILCHGGVQLSAEDFVQRGGAAADEGGAAFQCEIGV